MSGKIKLTREIPQVYWEKAWRMNLRDNENEELGDDEKDEDELDLMMISSRF